MSEVAIVILSDGESWGGLDGTSICFIDEDQHQSLCEGSVRVQDLKCGIEIGMADITHDGAMSDNE